MKKNVYFATIKKQIDREREKERERGDSGMVDIKRGIEAAVFWRQEQNTQRSDRITQ